MKFAIRDDDLNYFSDPTLVQQWYGEVFGQNISVGFATIPFVVPLYPVLDRGQGFPHDREYPLRDNSELVAYVRNNPQMEILLHGYNHESSQSEYIYEFSNGTSADLYKKVLKGKHELEELFGKPITVFVSPHDQISSGGIKAIEQAGINIIRGKGTKNFLFRFEYVVAVFKMIFYRLKFIGVSLEKIPAYPRVLDLGGHKEAFGIRIESNRGDLMNALMFAKKTNGNFILVNHIHDFSDKKKQLMLELITIAKEQGAHFCKTHELFDGSHS